MLLPYFLLACYCLLIAVGYDIYGKRFKANYITNAIITLYIIFITGTREVLPYTDTDNYEYYFTFITSIFETSEVFYNSLMLLVKYFTSSFTVFLIVVASLYYFCLNYSITKYAKHHNTNYYLAYFFFLSMFFNYSFTMNVMRQGLAVAFLLVALSINYAGASKSKLKVQFLTVLLLLLAFFSHHSSLIFILAISSVMFFSRVRLKFYYILFISAIIFSYINQSDMFGISSLLSSFGDSDSYTRYGSIQTDYTVGFKLQFVLFNTFCLLLAIRLFKSKLSNSNNYEILLKSYLLLSSVFFVSSIIPYSDRIGVYSWILIPYLLIPYLSYNYKYSKTIIIIGLVVFFTILNPQFF